MNDTRPLPKLNELNRFFWTGGADGVLRFLQCTDCATFIHPPQAVCRNCLSEALAPTAVPGTGVIDTLTVNYQAWAPGMQTPFVIARVAIDGAQGVYLTTNITGAAVEDVAIGDHVHVTFLEREDVWLPLFEKSR